MIHTVKPVLYIDPQQEPPASYCPVCGGALYRPSRHCLRCEVRTT